MMSEMDCGCQILGNEVLFKADKRIEKMGIDDMPELRNIVDSFILIGIGSDGLLGKCYEDLCKSIREAKLQVKEMNDDLVQDENTDSGDIKSYIDFLPDKWKNMLTNRHFINMYASYIVHYYYEMQASSKTSLDGDVYTKRNSSLNNGEGSENIALEDAEKKASKQLVIAKGYYQIFRANYADVYLSECHEKKKECGCSGNCDCDKKPVRQKRKRPTVTVL